MKLKELIDELIWISKENCLSDATVYINSHANFAIESNFLDKVFIHNNWGGNKWLIYQKEQNYIFEIS